ncbi:MAG TPA: T9SS type A sorting domain-containing protein [Flavobacteriaceae bacterium]|nr:T9SS type A sorting domain-containing protein [Flavobacteriaceae bacterium]
MKKITLILVFLWAVVPSYAQTLNQPANWPNAGWTVTGSYSNVLGAVESYPYNSDAFAFDDNAAGANSDDTIHAESPVIDLTAAFNANEFWLLLEVDYIFRQHQFEVLKFEYFDADQNLWVQWSPYSFPPNNTSQQNMFCMAAKTTYHSNPLDISGFTATQLAGFRYRIAYHDDPNTAGYGWGFCMNSPTLVSQVPEACVSPSELYVTNVSTTEAALGWIENGVATMGDIEFGTEGFLPTGNPTYAEVSNEYVVSGLSANTSYDFYVRANCGSGETSFWVGPLTFHTECDPIGGFTENFDAVPVWEIPHCWNVIANSTASESYAMVTDDTDGHSGTKSMRFYSDNDSTSEIFLSTPPLEALSQGNYQLRFYAKTNNSNIDIFRVGTMTDNTDETTFTMSGDILEITGEYQEFIVRFPDPVTDQYVVLYAKGDQAPPFLSSSYSVYVDDVSWEPIPDCTKPKSLMSANATETTVELYWTETGDATLWDIAVVPTGTGLSDSSFITGVGAPPYIATGLEGSTTYDFYVRADCGDGESLWAGPVSFSTVPSNDDIQNAIALVLGDNCLDMPYSTLNATIQASEPTPSCFFSGINNTVWFSFVAPSSGNVIVSTDYLPSELTDTQLAVFAAPSDINDLSTLGTALGCSEDDGEFSIASANVELSGLTPGAIYYIQVDGYQNNSGHFCITVNELPDFKYENDVWFPSDPNGVATADDNILIVNGTASFNQDMQLNNLQIKPGATLNVYDALELNGELIVSGSLVFKSTETQLGQIGDMSAVYSLIQGSITAERYIPRRDDFNGAYRYLASSVNTSADIHANWQEGATNINDNPNPGYGTFVTGSTGGFNGIDATPAGQPSMFTFNADTQAYEPVLATSTSALEAGLPYSMYIWGDRSLDIIANNEVDASSTTLRATGMLHFGEQIETDISSVANGFSLVGNPYQAIVDMSSVLSHSTNMSNKFIYVWDPNMGNRGAFVTVDLLNGGNGTAGASEANEYLQPGQALFVKTSLDGPASVSFQEGDKDVAQTQTDVFRPANDAAFVALQLYQTEIFENGGMLSDAVKINFTETADNTDLSDDAVKFTNLDENVGRMNAETLLSIENRKFPENAETLPLFINQYRSTEYVFNAVVNNLPEGTVAYLHDAYLNTQTELDNNASTPVYFTVNAADDLSKAPDRFSLIFATNSLSTDEVLTSNGLSIYPNPVKGGEFFIDFVGVTGEIAQVSLYNVLGQKVYANSTELNSSVRISVPVSSLKAGVYLVEIKHYGKIKTAKIVVQ